MQRPDPREFDRPDLAWNEDLLRRMDRRRIAAAFIGAILLHSSLALAFVNFQADRVEPPGEMVITVDLAPAMVADAAAETPPSDPSQAAPQQETPPDPETPPEEVVEDLKPEPLPEEPIEPEPEVVEEQKIEPPPPAEKAEVVTPTKPKPKPKPKSPPKPKPQAPQAASASNTPRADIAGSGARASPSEINRYTGRVRAAIEQKKGRTPSGSAGGVVYLSFTITSSGQVAGLRLTKSSGDPAVDSAARSAVMNANIPPIPEGLPSFNIGVPIRFDSSR